MNYFISNEERIYRYFEIPHSGWTGRIERVLPVAYHQYEYINNDIISPLPFHQTVKEMILEYVVYKQIQERDFDRAFLTLSLSRKLIKDIYTRYFSPFKCRIFESNTIVAYHLRLSRVFFLLQTLLEMLQTEVSTPSPNYFSLEVRLDDYDALWNPLEPWSITTRYSSRGQSIFYMGASMNMMETPEVGEDHFSFREGKHYGDVSWIFGFKGAGVIHGTLYRPCFPMMFWVADLGYLEGKTIMKEGRNWLGVNRLLKLSFGEEASLFFVDQDEETARYMFKECK